MNNTSCLSAIVDTDRYPLADTEAVALTKQLDHIHQALAQSGCCVLPGFIRPEMLSRMCAESASLASEAYYKTETVNAYNIDVQQALPEGHPARIQFQRGNAFVARDRIPTQYIIQQLYTHAAFQRFIAASFKLDQVYELADPLAGLCINILQPGKQHPWHFDTNEFTVSMLTQESTAGGVFEYYPDIRSASSENLDQVHRVLSGQADGVRQLPLRCGDLQLFKGRYSLHRVTPVEGDSDRYSAIFAYTRSPGVIGRAERSKQLFGRTHPVHERDSSAVVRNDRLLD